MEHFFLLSRGGRFAAFFWVVVAWFQFLLIIPLSTFSACLCDMLNLSFTFISSKSKIPVWPFVALSCIGGAYALLPYFVLWNPPAPPVEETELKKRPLSVLESKLTASVRSWTYSERVIAIPTTFYADWHRFTSDIACSRNSYSYICWHCWGCWLEGIFPVLQGKQICKYCQSAIGSGWFSPSTPFFHR